MIIVRVGSLLRFVRLVKCWFWCNWPLADYLAVLCAFLKSHFISFSCTWLDKKLLKSLPGSIPWRPAATSKALDQGCRETKTRMAECAWPSLDWIGLGWARLGWDWAAQSGNEERHRKRERKKEDMKLLMKEMLQSLKCSQPSQDMIQGNVNKKRGWIEGGRRIKELNVASSKLLACKMCLGRKCMGDNSRL